MNATPRQFIYDASGRRVPQFQHRKSAGVLQRAAALTAIALAALLPACTSVYSEVDDVRSPSHDHMTRLMSLEGAWIARGDGFSSRLTYEWAMPGVLLRTHNTLRNDDGKEIGVYEGNYAWNPTAAKYTFWAAGRDGTLHEGEAEWRQDQLWHLANVYGGKVTGYRSMLEFAGDALQYRAKYSHSASDAEVIAAPALIYHRVTR